MYQVGDDNEFALVQEVPKDVCVDVPVQNCKIVQRPVPKQKCQVIEHDDCHFEEKMECRDEPREVCKDVTKEDCDTTASERCEMVPVEDCQFVERQVEQPECQAVILCSPEFCCGRYLNRNSG